MQKLVYLASPYSHADAAVMQRRFEIVKECTAALSRMGHVIFSPILHSHQMAVDHALPPDWEGFWKPIDTVFLHKADVLWVLTIDGWRVSRGVTEEIQIMQDAKKDIFFLHPDDVLGREVK